MSRIEEFAVYCTTAQTANYTALDGSSRLTVVKKFYKENGLEIPASITVKTTKKGSYLTKDEKIGIQADYITALQAGEIPEELSANFEAVKNPEAVATFSRTLVYSEAVKEFGPAIVSAKMIDALPVNQNEDFHKIRKFDVPASVAIDEIPAFIKALQKIYDESTKPATATAKK